MPSHDHWSWYSRILVFSSSAFLHLLPSITKGSASCVFRREMRAIRGPDSVISRRMVRWGLWWRRSAMYLRQNVKVGPNSLALRLAQSFSSVRRGRRTLCFRVLGSRCCGICLSCASLSARESAALLMVIIICGDYKEVRYHHSTILSITFYNLSIYFSSVLSRAFRCFYNASFFFKIVISFLFSASRSFFTPISYSMVARCWFMAICSDCFSLLESISCLCRSISWLSISFFISMRRLQDSELLSFASRSCFLRDSLSSLHSLSLFFVSFLRAVSLYLKRSAWLLISCSLLASMLLNRNTSSFSCEFSFCKLSLAFWISERQEDLVCRSLSNFSDFLCSLLRQWSFSWMSVSILFLREAMLSWRSFSLFLYSRWSASRSSCLLASSSSSCSTLAFSLLLRRASSYLSFWMSCCFQLLLWKSSSRADASCSLRHLFYWVVASRSLVTSEYLVWYSLAEASLLISSCRQRFLSISRLRRSSLSWCSCDSSSICMTNRLLSCAGS